MTREINPLDRANSCENEILKLTLVRPSCIGEAMHILNRGAFFILGISVLAIHCVKPASAADTGSRDEGNTWTFSVAPYAWGAGFSGDVGLFKRPPVPFDLRFSDVLDNLKFSAMTVVEAHNGEWGVLGDLMYVHVEADEGIERLVAGKPLALNVDVTGQNLTATLMGEYRIFSVKDLSVDVMAGARFWDVTTDLSAKLAVGGVELAQFSGKDGSSWVDPMAGVKTRMDISDSVYCTAWGMIGGVGVGSSLSWDVMAGLGYQWNNGFSTVVGYRALGVDYGHDGFVYDVVQQGAFVGGVFSF